ncbi:MAG: TIGR00269 family protein [Methanotrichaceae archaeon]
MRCSKCDENAIVSQRYSGRHLCASHFIEDFDERVEVTLEKRHMVEEGDRIAVAVSGGKDSIALLYALNSILTGMDVKIFAITVDEGIKGYRDDTIRSAKRIAEDLGIEHRIVSFRDLFGFDLDDIIEGKEVAPCTYCGVFRKNALNRTAKLMGATKVATGHNLDDEAQSVLMNYLKGDIERLMRFRPRRVQPGLVPRIKPFREIPEKETALYCMTNGIYVDSRECPYAKLSLRADVRDMINRLENLYPGTKQSILKSFEKFSELAGSRWTQMDLASCGICGEPCVKDICKACELLGKLSCT